MEERSPHKRKGQGSSPVSALPKFNKPKEGNMKKLIVFVMFLVLSAFTFLGGTMTLPVNHLQLMDGDTIPIGARTVVWGINQAIQDKPGTMIFQNGSKYVIMWRDTYGAMFFAFDSDKQTTLAQLSELAKSGGSLSNHKTGTELIEFMKNNGWKVIPGSLAPEVAKSIAVNGFLSLAVTAMSSLPTFIFTFEGFIDPCNTSVDLSSFGEMYCKNVPSEPG